MADKKTSLSPAKNIFKDQRVLLAIVIALIVVIISCINPNFIGINNIVAIFQQICVLGILTMAMSILLISGGIDLSIGNIMVVYQKELEDFIGHIEAGTPITVITPADVRHVLSVIVAIRESLETQRTVTVS